MGRVGDEWDLDKGSEDEQKVSHSRWPLPLWTCFPICKVGMGDGPNGLFGAGQFRLPVPGVVTSAVRERDPDALPEGQPQVCRIPGQRPPSPALFQRDPAPGQTGDELLWQLS